MIYNEEVWKKHIAEINPVSGDCSLVDDAVMLWADEKIKQLATELAKNAELTKVVEHLAECGYLYHGAEGMDNDQQILYDA